MENNPCAGTRFLIGSTGLNPEQLSRWEQYAKSHNCPVLIAPNTSTGVLLTLQSALNIAKGLHGLDFDIEILESHHRNKIDSPSGTAMFLANNIAEHEKLSLNTNRTGKRKTDELGVVALRGGSVFGEHTVRFMGDYEEIMITHRALSRDLFASGALTLGKWLMNQNQGRIVQLTEVSF